MTLVVTILEVGCREEAMEKCKAEIRWIAAELRTGNLETGLSRYLPDEEQMLTFVTHWPGAYNPNLDWAMDSELEFEVRERLLAVDPSVRVHSWETVGTLILGSTPQQLEMDSSERMCRLPPDEGPT